MTEPHLERGSIVSRAVSHNLFWPIVALLALIAANTIRRPNFLSITIMDGHLFGSLIDIMRSASPLLLVALGMTLVIATRGIDLSVGSMIAISGALALSYIQASPSPNSITTVVPAVLIALAVCLLLGAWNGFMVSVLGIQPIIATLILMMAGRGIAMLITGGFITTVNSTPYKALGSGWFLGLPIPSWIAGLTLVAVLLLCRWGALGMLVEAVGINPAAARLAGVRSRVIIWTVYIVAGLFAGIAGILLSADTMAADANNAGLFYELDAILAVVIGGTSLAGGKFSLSGTFVGVLVIATLSRTVTILGISPLITPLFKALVVILVMLLQSPVVREKLEAMGRRRRRNRATGEAVSA
ncbi:MAG TPA: ABC transporter permease [Tessaracoccus flavescens]|uniref:ABC transporter permease n=1 Tax=Tessaracoccus flavescens TaxID=399497 RepID=A0A921ELF4_9ACTN|nr:ABC transporter permease [Tessaracoccus flavescens]